MYEFLTAAARRKRSVPLLDSDDELQEEKVNRIEAVERVEKRDINQELMQLFNGNEDESESEVVRERRSLESGKILEADQVFVSAECYFYFSYK